METSHHMLLLLTVEEKLFENKKIKIALEMFSLYKSFVYTAETKIGAVFSILVKSILQIWKISNSKTIEYDLSVQDNGRQP
jgi:hypothetical protein